MACEHTLLSLALNDEPSVQSALTVESEPGTDARSIRGRWHS